MRAAILAATVICGLATTARADVVFYDTNFSASAKEINLNGNNSTGLRGFDPTLGTLTSASLEVIATFDFSPYTLVSNGAGPLPTSASVTPYLGGLLALSIPTSFATQANLSVVNEQIVGLQSFNIDVTSSLPLNDAADPSVNLSPYAEITAANGGYDAEGTADRDPTTLRGFVRVYYDYTPAPFTASAVPEPASLAMLGMGIAAFGAVRRRSRLDRAG